MSSEEEQLDEDTSMNGVFSGNEEQRETCTDRAVGPIQLYHWKVYQFLWQLLEDYWKQSSSEEEEVEEFFPDVSEEDIDSDDEINTCGKTKKR